MKLIAVLAAAASLALLAGCSAEKPKPATANDPIAQMNAELAHAIGTTQTTSAEVKDIGTELPSERTSLTQPAADEEAAPVRTWGESEPAKKP